jgi:hypothetical protein
MIISNIPVSDGLAARYIQTNKPISNGAAAGILLIIMSIAHNIYGELIQIPALKKLTHDSVINYSALKLFTGFAIAALID